jgi:hypothetical protein
VIPLTADNRLHLNEGRSTMLWVNVALTLSMGQRLTIDGRLLQVIGLGSAAQQKNGRYRVTVKEISQ